MWLFDIWYAIISSITGYHPIIEEYKRDAHKYECAIYRQQLEESMAKLHPRFAEIIRHFPNK
jgi:hypothetical protein